LTIDKKLEQLARYVNKLIVIFKNDQQVTAAEPYQLLVHLFKEQCEVVDKSDSAKGSGTGKRIKIKRKSKG
jgi:hypothetical protein